jgi:2-oxoisovalerate dehydrogenase E1 component beta subunit
MAVKTFIEAIRDGLGEEMRRDPTVVVLGEDVGKKGGVFLATDGLWAEFGDDRVIDTPLTESMIVGASLGAALNGLRPVAEIQFADFIFPAFNQIVSEVARMRYRTVGASCVPMVIRAPFGGGVHGAMYHSQSVEAFFTHVPGIKTVVPSTPYDAKGLLRASIRDDDPVLFLEHKKLYRSVRGDVPTGDYTVPIGRAVIRRPGRRLTLAAYGLMVHYALEAAEKVAEEGIDCEVIDLRSLRPLDRETLLSSVRKTGKCLVAYEDNRFGGYGAEIAAIVAEEAFDYLDGPVSRIAGPDTPAMPYNHLLEEWFMLSPVKIAEAVRKLAAY